MADISLLVVKITFVVAELIIKEQVITSSVAKITYVVAEITFKVVIGTSPVAKITRGGGGGGGELVNHTR